MKISRLFKHYFGNHDINEKCSICRNRIFSPWSLFGSFSFLIKKLIRIWKNTSLKNQLLSFFFNLIFKLISGNRNMYLLRGTWYYTMVLRRIMSGRGCAARKTAAASGAAARQRSRSVSGWKLRQWPSSREGPTCGKKRDNIKGLNNFCIRWWRGFPRVAPPYNNTPAARSPTFCFPFSI